MEYKVIEGGGITSPKGFTAGAVYVGVKSRKTQKPDVAVLYSETEASCAAVFTTNKFCAAPVILDREILKNGKARAIVITSGNANAATGDHRHTFHTTTNPIIAVTTIVPVTAMP